MTKPLLLYSTLLLLSLTPLLSTASFKELDPKEKTLKKYISKRLSQVINTYSIQTGQYSINSNQIAFNDLNPNLSETTYHSFVWNFCLRWIKGKNNSPERCQLWLDPYVSIHGLTSEDKSKLEGLVAAHWLESVAQGMNSILDPEQFRNKIQVRYRIWDIKAKNPNQSILLSHQDTEPRDLTGTRFGSLNMQNIADIRLIPSLKQEIEKVAFNKATTDIKKLAYDKKKHPFNSKNMPSLVALRALASIWTRQMRNRLLSIIGESRATQPGVEFFLGPVRATCQAFLKDINQLEAFAPHPGTLPIEFKYELTQRHTIQNRLALCRALRNLPYYTIPKVTDKGIELGNTNTERADHALARINLALIDYVGLNPNSLPHHPRLNFSKKDYSQLYDIFINGNKRIQATLTNKEVLQMFNRQLEFANQKYKQTISRNPNLKSEGENPTRKYKLKVGRVDLVSLNGLTETMKRELTNITPSTGQLLPQSGQFNPEPDKLLEKKPSQLTIKRMGE